MKETASPVSREETNILVKLKAVQDKSGYIPEAEMARIASECNTSVSDVYGVATFYSFLCTEPRGRNIIQVCQSVPCYLKDSEAVRGKLIELLKIGPGETTPDGRFSLVVTNCIGACDMAPAMLINGKLHGNLTVDNLVGILQSYP